MLPLELGGGGEKKGKSFLDGSSSLPTGDSFEQNRSVSGPMNLYDRCSLCFYNPLNRELTKMRLVVWGCWGQRLCERDSVK